MVAIRDSVSSYFKGRGCGTCMLFKVNFGLAMSKFKAFCLAAHQKKTNRLAAVSSKCRGRKTRSPFIN